VVFPEFGLPARATIILCFMLFLCPPVLFLSGLFALPYVFRHAETSFQKKITQP
jgi:hypothetical protein